MVGGILLNDGMKDVFAETVHIFDKISGIADILIDGASASGEDVESTKIDVEGKIGALQGFYYFFLSFTFSFIFFLSWSFTG